ncbi:MAG TPA: hypothetical protein VF752_05560 [Thermoleophilaceae bacterium]
MRTRRAVAGLALAALAGIGLGAPGAPTFSSFSATTASSGSSFSAAADWTAPSASASVIGKSSGGVTGYVRPSGTYYVYANVADSGNPASGVSSVKADVSSVTTGQTAVALSQGSYAAGGQTFNYRSAQLTASALPAGTKSYTPSLTDSAGNSTTQSGFSVVMDSTGPSASGVQTANGGATVGKAEAGDTVTFTFNEPIEPLSILSGWSGSATAVSVRIANNTSGSTNDTLQVLASGTTTVLPLTSTAANTGLDLGGKSYVTADVTFNSSSMQVSGNSVVVTLGTPSGATGTGSAGTMKWTPNAATTDRAGNVLSPVTAVSETGTSDAEF